MSLTSILTKEKGRTNLKSWFRHHFPNPGLNSKNEILISPKNNDSSYRGEIGTAFDYLFRFNLQRINKKNFSSRTSWVAEDGLNQVLFLLGLPKESHIKIGYNKDRLIDRVKFINHLEKEFTNAQENFQQFIKNGKLTNTLIKSSVFLAKLDVTSRAQFIDSNLDNIRPESIDELNELFTIVPWNLFKAEEQCLLNPNFGIGTAIVGGADADLIIDNTLIDIKSTKDLEIDRKNLNQIIGYALLSIIDNNQGGKNLDIKRVGIYFARFGEFWNMPLSDFCDKDKFVCLADEFSRLVKDKNLQLIPSDNFKIKKTKSSNTTRSNKKLDRDTPVEFDFGNEE